MENVSDYHSGLVTQSTAGILSEKPDSKVDEAFVGQN